MNLFVKKNFLLNSGQASDFKIECDALTDKDIKTLAYLIGSKYEFGAVVGVPRGGLRIAKALEKYKEKVSPTLMIVDDVLTTGNSMERHRISAGLMGVKYIRGIVIFARGKCPDWITPVFQFEL